jgi:hypothetical protein
MSLTLQQANQALANVTTADELRSLINQLSVESDPSGKVTILYSGWSTTNDMVSNSQIIQAMLKNGEDIRIIDNTDAAKFLQLNDKLPGFNEVLAAKLDSIVGGDPGERSSPANKFLFGDVDAKGTRIPNGAWDNVSARFVADTVGEVRTITGGALDDKVFAQTEIPAALKNTNITHIDGIARTDLAAKGEAEAFKAISAHSNIDSAGLKVATDANGNILLDANGQPRIDSRAYFEATGLQGKAPVLELPNYKNLAEFMPDRLSQHEAGAKVLQDIKAQYEAQSKTPDLPGQDNAALRASTCISKTTAANQPHWLQAA